MISNQYVNFSTCYFSESLAEKVIFKKNLIEVLFFIKGSGGTIYLSSENKNISAKFCLFTISQASVVRSFF